jgi:hypothetical protein
MRQVEATHLGVDDGTCRRPILPFVLAMVALGCRSTLFLDLEQRTVGMGASGHAVTFDTGRAGVLLFVDENHDEVGTR